MALVESDADFHRAYTQRAVEALEAIAANTLVIAANTNTLCDRIEDLDVNTVSKLDDLRKGLHSLNSSAFHGLDAIQHWLRS